MFIQNVLPHLHAGYYDVSVEDTWRWVDCNYATPWQDTMWAPGQPDNIGQQDCAIIDQNGELYDQICDDNFHFICEITPKSK